MKIFTLVAILTLFVINPNFGQVTISNIEKENYKIYPKPPEFDSTQNWKSQNKYSDYKKYIGVQIYLPPYELPESTTTSYNPFLYSEPSISPLIMETVEKWKQGYMLNHDKTLVELKFENMYTIVYKPTQYYVKPLSQGGGEPEISAANGIEATNTYYRVIDILYGDKISDLKRRFQMLLNEKKTETINIRSRYSQELYKNKYSKIWDNYEEKIIVEESGGFFSNNFELLFVLKNEKNQDTVYTSNQYSFVLVPYFVHRQSTLTNKEFILDDIGSYNKLTGFISKNDIRKTLEYEDNYGNIRTQFKEIKVQYGTIWKCIDVTLIAPDYKIMCIFENSNGEQFTIADLELYSNTNRLIPLDVYNERERNKKLKKEELVKKQELESKELKLKSQKVEQKRIAQLVAKYGQELGTIIADRKVKIGMTMEMCEDSWGTPFNKSKTITANLSSEIWLYGFGYRLYFKNSKLIEINE